MATGSTAGVVGATGTLPEPNPTEFLQIDHDEEEVEFNDADSSLGSDISSTSTSLTSSIRDYKYENGRRYHAYREGEYVLPNDEKEQDRMDLHHHVFRLSLGGLLYRSPLPKTPQRVLDLGTGTGIWAVEFADEHPSATVIGNDLSPIQPTWVPTNCRFIVDDIENEWLYTPDEAFDFIHGRGLGGSVRDWDRLYAEAYNHLTPGGWFEQQEYEAWIRSDDDPELLNAPAVAQWQQLVDEASLLFGKRVNIAESVEAGFIRAGFEDVRDDIYKVPIGTWPLEKSLKTMGMYQQEQMCDCVESFTLALLTRVLKWSNEETQVLMANVRSNFRNKKNHLYCKFHYVYGRKPINA
ncbi:methyltransferase [Phlyctema vagabunda]|uniref:Methyltransferase n=1 Tax=Phlyctema vagabunda TaxID=108571 RepID=A0ABR4PGC2_9HELO